LESDGLRIAVGQFKIGETAVVYEQVRKNCPAERSDVSEDLHHSHRPAWRGHADVRHHAALGRYHYDLTSLAGRMLAQDNSISADQMKLVLDVASLLAMTADLDALLTRIATAATELANAERASIFLHDPKTDELWTKVALGIESREIRVPANAGIVGHVFQANQTELVADPYSDKRFNRDVDRRTGFRTRNLLTVPVKNLDRKQIGVLQIVNRVGGPFTESDRILMELLADQAGVAIQRYYLQMDLQAQAVKTATLAFEMTRARKVQMAMIPKQTPEVCGLTAASWAIPASITGGDTYDLWQLEDGRMGIFLGDASGHGMDTALVISQARTLIRALSQINCDPMWLLTRVNDRLAQDLEPGKFVTAFIGCLSSEGVLNWCSAGHGPMFVRTGTGASTTTLEPLGPPLGVIPECGFDVGQPIQLEPGGCIIVMSDGIFEARNGKGQLFEVERIVELLDRHREKSPAEVAELLKEAVREWQGTDEPFDDQTVVIVQRTV
jgi:phosphoserine phosphatase